MKTYKLILIKENLQIGEVRINTDFTNIKVHLLEEKQENYQLVFSEAIKELNRLYNIKVDFKDWVITNFSKLFWTALVQTLFLNMGILVVEIDSSLHSE